MKRILFFAVLMASTLGIGFAATHTVTNSGFTFSPDSINIAAGDSVKFVLASTHNAIEVTKATWDINGNTAKAGGFSVPMGGGKVAFPTDGTHYYVCFPHAHLGMKGVIIVGSGITPIPTVSDIIPSMSVYPNPASDFITISYTLSTDADVNIKLINLIGVEVASILKDSQSAGPYQNTYSLNKNLAPGIYFVSVSAGNQSYFDKVFIK